MPDRFSFLLNSEKFEFWNDLQITLSLDSIDTFSCQIPERNQAEFAELFRPFAYNDVQILFNDEIIFTGTVINRSLSLSGQNLSIGGYSRCGVLNDVCVPADKFPLEFQKQSLTAIALKLAGYYSIPVKFSSVPGAVFDSVSPEPESKILEFLIRLAQKRNLLVSNTLAGELHFFNPTETSPIALLEQGNTPLSDFSVSIDEQNVFSKVTVFGAASPGTAPESFSVNLPLLSHVKREFSYVVSDSTGADLQKAVQFKAARLFAEAFQITASLSTLKDSRGEIFQPGAYLRVKVPDVFFSSETNLMLRSAAISIDSSSNVSSSLSLIFPQIYSGKFPEEIGS